MAKISDVLGLSEKEFQELWERYHKEFCKILSSNDTFTGTGRDLMEWLNTEDKYEKCVYLAQQFGLLLEMCEDLRTAVVMAKKTLPAVEATVKALEGALGIDMLKVDLVLSKFQYVHTEDKRGGQ